MYPTPPKKTEVPPEKKLTPPSHHLKNLNLQENEKNITPCKSFNHPKIASTIMKKPQTPYLKNFQFLNSFEVTQPIKPSPHEKISIPENLTPFRKLQSCYARENRN